MPTRRSGRPSSWAVRQHGTNNQGNLLTNVVEIDNDNELALENIPQPMDKPMTTIFNNKLQEPPPFCDHFGKFITCWIVGTRMWGKIICPR